MEQSARMYNCVGCHRQITLCSACDRNNIYCGSTCAHAARVRSCHLACQRYQKSLRGRHKHAARQQQYRDRLRKKVTHHTSTVLPPRVVLPKQLNERMLVAIKGYLHCHFCGKPCSLFLRRSYLRHSRQHLPYRSSAWPFAP